MFAALVPILFTVVSLVFTVVALALLLSMLTRPHAVSEPATEPRQAATVNTDTNEDESVVLEAPAPMNNSRPVTVITPRHIPRIQRAAGAEPSDPIVIRPAAELLRITPREGNPQQGDAVIIRPAAPTTITPAAAEPAVIIRPVETPPVVVQPGVETVVTPAETATVLAKDIKKVKAPPRPAWEEQGWTRRKRGGMTIYDGRFQALDHRRGKQQMREFPGQITQEGRTIYAYIANPPEELLRRHPKHACFWWHEQRGNDAWFYVNWARVPESAEAALLYVEHLLSEALNVYSR